MTQEELMLYQSITGGFDKLGVAIENWKNREHQKARDERLHRMRMHEQKNATDEQIRYYDETGKIANRLYDMKMEIAAKWRTADRNEVNRMNLQLTNINRTLNALDGERARMMSLAHMKSEGYQLDAIRQYTRKEQLAIAQEETRRVQSDGMGVRLADTVFKRLINAEEDTTGIGQYLRLASAGPEAFRQAALNEARGVVTEAPIADSAERQRRAELGMPALESPSMPHTEIPAGGLGDGPIAREYQRFLSMGQESYMDDTVRRFVDGIAMPDAFGAITNAVFSDAPGDELQQLINDDKYDPDLIVGFSNRLSDLVEGARNNTDAFQKIAGAASSEAKRKAGGPLATPNQLAILSALGDRLVPPLDAVSNMTDPQVSNLHVALAEARTSFLHHVERVGLEQAIDIYGMETRAKGVVARALRTTLNDDTLDEAFVALDGITPMTEVETWLKTDRGNLFKDMVLTEAGIIPILKKHGATAGEIIEFGDMTGDEYTAITGMVALPDGTDRPATWEEVEAVNGIVAPGGEDENGVPFLLQVQQSPKGNYIEDDIARAKARMGPEAPTEYPSPSAGVGPAIQTTGSVPPSENMLATDQRETAQERMQPPWMKDLPPDDGTVNWKQKALTARRLWERAERDAEIQDRLAKRYPDRYGEDATRPEEREEALQGEFKEAEIEAPDVTVPEYKSPTGTTGGAFDSAEGRSEKVDYARMSGNSRWVNKFLSMGMASPALPFDKNYQRRRKLGERWWDWGGGNSKVGQWAAAGASGRYGYSYGPGAEKIQNELIQRQKDDLVAQMPQDETPDNMTQQVQVAQNQRALNVASGVDVEKGTEGQKPVQMPQMPKAPGMPRGPVA